MNDFSDICNRLFVALFEKYLVPLELQGYAHHVRYPEEMNEDLILAYEKEIYIEIIRTSHCEVYMMVSDTKESSSEYKRIVLPQLIFLFSNKETRLSSLFSNIGCYYGDYEPNIKQICSTFFQYYDEIINAVKTSNFRATQQAIKKNGSNYRQADAKARRANYLTNGKG